MLRTNQKELRIQKGIKRKGNKLYVKWEGYNNLFNSWIDKKKTLYKISQYFSKPYRIFGGDINVKVNLPDYATKLDLKNETWGDRSKVAAKFDLTSLKAEIGKIDFDKLKAVPVNISKLSIAVNNEVVKKTVW